MDVLGLLDVALGAVPGADTRPGQRDMTVAVDRALRRREHLLVQAGTGTGKSLAYLVPALTCGRRVVVATATKALQAQLVDKDLPRLAAALAPALGRTPTFALAKGRGNYVCRQRLQEGQDAPDGLFAAPAGELGRQVLALREWAADAETGDRDEVPFPVGDAAWRQVSVSARDCLGGRCPDRTECFSEKAREAAREADVVVANHTLLALDVFTDASVLPEHDAVVLDEAHEFVASVTDALTVEIAAPAVRRAAAAAREFVAPATAERLEDAGAVLDGVLGGLPTGWLPAVPASLADALGVAEQVCGSAAAEVAADREGGSDEVAAARRDRARTALGDLASAAGRLRSAGSAGALHATADRTLRLSPLQVGGALAEQLFGASTVVATSATLTLGGSFEHVAGGLGLSWPAPGTRAPGSSGTAPAAAIPAGPAAPTTAGPAASTTAGPAASTAAGPVARWRHLDVGSPFDYRRQGQLWVARDLPDPGRMPQSWAAAVDELLVELVTAAGGRTLALFSSTAAAARAAAAVRAGTDFPVLLQGEDSASALQHRFAADAGTCLFGTRSFWQGVDVPGSACQLVVIDRIPFPHVEDPLLKARLAAAGERGFLDVTLPPAAVLLAQGAGRLIRTPTDRGVVVVLDPRLATARYGGLLVQTLPGFFPARDKAGVLASLRAIDAGAASPVPAGLPPAQRRRLARA